MATVTGLTAERMLEIEAASVVDGAVVDDILILIRHDGSQIITDNVRGPQGDPGADAVSLSYEQNFVLANTTWTINHNLGTQNLSVRSEITPGVSIEGNVVYVSDDVIEIHFYHPQTGTARVWS
jgi:hypothetical protein